MVRGGRTSPPRHAPRRGRVATSHILEHIARAVAEHRLPPGTRLAEETLGEHFGVSRTKIRQALFQLARDKLVTLVPGRGAFVAEPSVREARELFEARRIIERALVERAARVATADSLARLHDHLERERRAIQANDGRARNRLLGEFHVLIAEMAGNAVLTDMLGELLSRTSLVTLLYQPMRAASKSWEEHCDVVEAVERQDAGRAVALMLSHIDNVERGLALPNEPEPVVDLRAALR
jgi:DNA-binding GntR family transcriptional regulator